MRGHQNGIILALLVAIVVVLCWSEDARELEEPLGLNSRVAFAADTRSPAMQARRPEGAAPFDSPREPALLSQSAVLVDDARGANSAEDSTRRHRKLELEFEEDPELSSRVDAAAQVKPVYELETMDWSQPSRKWHLLVRKVATPGLVEGLRDDDIRYNAGTCSYQLKRRLQSPATGRETRQVLEGAIADPEADPQQRRFAAGLLQAHFLRNQAVDRHAPSKALLDLSVQYIGEPYRNWYADGNADSVREHQSVAFALANMDSMEERLIRSFKSPSGSLAGDPVGSARVDFMLAFLIAKGAKNKLPNRTAPILIEHLEDNHVSDDALMAMEALVELKSSARSWLWASLDSGDDQKDRCIQLLLLELEGPATTRAEHEKRKALNSVTWKYDNPASSWRYLKDDNARGGLPPGVQVP